MKSGNNHRGASRSKRKARARRWRELCTAWYEVGRGFPIWGGSAGLPGRQYAHVRRGLIHTARAVSGRAAHVMAAIYAHCGLET